MPKRIQENYLKAMIGFEHQGLPISVNALATKLNVKKSSVNSMIYKFSDEDLVEYEAYKPIKLTVQGRQLASRVVRRHRLSEMYLSEMMGFGWDEVHEIAEEIEHINHEQLFDRMDKLLGYPKLDPHGSPIPDKDGNIVSEQLSLLSESNTGVDLCIKSVKAASSDFLQFLDRKKLKLGSKIQIKERYEFDGSIEIFRIEQAEEPIHLSKEAAQRIFVGK